MRKQEKKIRNFKGVLLEGIKQRKIRRIWDETFCRFLNAFRQEVLQSN